MCALSHRNLFSAVKARHGCRDLPAADTLAVIVPRLDRLPYFVVGGGGGGGAGFGDDVFKSMSRPMMPPLGSFFVSKSRIG